MRLFPVGLVLLALAGTASAVGEPLLEIVYENASSLEACLAGTVQGAVGLEVDTGADPPVQLTAPAIAPPTPDCLVLP